MILFEEDRALLFEVVVIRKSLDPNPLMVAWGYSMCRFYTEGPDISTELALSYFIGNSEEREGRREFIGWEKEAKRGNQWKCRRLGRSNRGRKLPGPSLPWPHRVKDRLPLIRRHIQSHVFIHSSSGTGVETANEESFPDARLYFEFFIWLSVVRRISGPSILALQCSMCWVSPEWDHHWFSAALRCSLNL